LRLTDQQNCCPSLREEKTETIIKNANKYSPLIKEYSLLRSWDGRPPRVVGGFNQARLLMAEIKDLKMMECLSRPFDFSRMIRAGPALGNIAKKLKLSWFKVTGHTFGKSSLTQVRQIMECRQTTRKGGNYVFSKI